MEELLGKKDKMAIFSFLMSEVGSSVYVAQ
jgi:hypothetical protein